MNKRNEYKPINAAVAAWRSHKISKREKSGWILIVVALVLFIGIYWARTTS